MLMMRKRKALGAVLGLVAMGLSTGLWAQAVTVVMTDGTVVKGDLLGVDNGTLSLQKASGKSQDIAVDDIKKVFDADHKVVSLDGATAAGPRGDAADDADTVAPAAKAAADDEPADDVVPRRHAKRRLRASAATDGSDGSHRNGLRGRKVAGEVLFWSGTAVTLVGLGAILYGNGQESSATSSYCPTGQCSDGYHDYTISGYPGYYTYDEYTQYYYGQAWVDGGVVVGCVGLACMLTGLIITPSGREMENASLLNYNDHQLSLGIPNIGVNRYGGPKASLLSATF